MRPLVMLASAPPKSLSWSRANNGTFADCLEQVGLVRLKVDQQC